MIKSPSPRVRACHSPGARVPEAHRARVDPDAGRDASQGRTGVDPDRRGQPAAAALRHQQDHCDNNGDPITMLALIVLVLIAVVALTVLSFAVHVLFSPWLLLLAAVGVLAWLKFRPRRSHR